MADGVDLQALNDAYRNCIVAGRELTQDMINWRGVIKNDGQLGNAAAANTVSEIAIGNASAVRSALYLGSSATKDAVGGGTNVMTEGAWGFGGPSGSVDSDFGQDFNTEVRRTLVGATTGTWQNGPLGNTGHTGVLVQLYRGFSNQTIQRWFQYGTTKYLEYWRAINPGTGEKTGWHTATAMESGSNSNGQFYRFAGGFQICTNTMSVTTTSSDWSTLSSTSGLYYKTLTWNYPSLFEDRPFFSATPAYYAWTRGASTSGGGSARMDLVRESAASGTFDVEWFAMGTWR